jgi:ketosteroid isomerase-like protein
VSQADPLLSARGAQAVYAYALAVDERDARAMDDLVVDDVALTRLDGTRQGREAFLNFYRDFWSSSVHQSLHAVTNVRARPLTDGTILVDSYFSASMVDPEGDRIVIGRYSDTFVDDGSQLRLAHKRITIDGVFRF